MDGNVKDTPPIVFVPGEKDRGRWDAVLAELAEAKSSSRPASRSARPEFDKWLAAATPGIRSG